jgi:hypothetical protein
MNGRFGGTCCFHLQDRCVEAAGSLMIDVIKKWIVSKHVNAAISTANPETSVNIYQKIIRFWVWPAMSPCFISEMILKLDFRNHSKIFLFVARHVAL